MRQGQAVSILTTEDGGETWFSHSAGKGAILQISFSDAKHGLIRTFTSLLFTVDGGANWLVVSSRQYSEDIKRFPCTFSFVTLYSFLRVHGKYWAVGTEVIHKDQPGGGYGVTGCLELL